MARIEIENIRQKLQTIRERVDELVGQFLEPTTFVHKDGCENVVLKRSTERKGSVATTIRLCESCGASDSYSVDYSNYPPPRFWG